MNTVNYNMMKFLISIIFILTFFLSPNIYSQAADNEIQAGLTDIYNLKFEDAESKFRELQRNIPMIPKVTSTKR